MPYFPLFTLLSEKTILIIGAGNVGARKIEKLLPFQPHMHIVARKISAEVFEWAKNPAHKMNLYQRDFHFDDLQNKDIVIVATDDLQMQKEVFQYCCEKKIPVNCVDVPEYCSFIFPALVLRGDAVIGISTGGKAPGLSRQLRTLLEQILPEQLNEIVDQISHFRLSQKQNFSNFTDRAEKVEILAKDLLNKYFPSQTKKD